MSKRDHITGFISTISAITKAQGGIHATSNTFWVSMALTSLIFQLS
jgi:hypothetical protein